MRMREYKTLLYVAAIFMSIFIVINYLFISKLTSELKQISTSLVSNEIEIAIKEGIEALPLKYKIAKENDNSISKEFIKLLLPTKNVESYEYLWSLPKNWIVGNQLYSNKSLQLGNVLYSLRSAKIIYADVDSRGTQLKLLLTLEGGQKAVFKPQWYKLSHVVFGPVYSGKDRYNAEIIAFYLAGILNFRSVPFSVERCIKLNSEILPVATGRLRVTIDIRNGSWCVYGVCHYCRYNDSACESSRGLCGALIMHVPDKLKLHRSPWQRKYKGNNLAEWQIKNDYCIKVKQVLKINRLLDLIDVSIFDFLIQNGDRHHYETINNRILFLDNGKAFGNPSIHHLDILAPLYQCCIIRLTTWNRVQQLAGGKLKNILLEITKNTPLLTDEHLNALEERLLMVFSAVELCMRRYPNRKMFY